MAHCSDNSIDDRLMKTHVLLQQGELIKLTKQIADLLIWPEYGEVEIMRHLSHVHVCLK